MEQGYALLYASEAHTQLLAPLLELRVVVAKNRMELLTTIAKRSPAIIYIDLDLLPQLKDETDGAPVVAIVDGGTDAIVRTLQNFPWLSHVATKAMLSAASARATVARLQERITNGPEQHVLGAAGVGRVALLASSSRREQRLERMREFLEARGMANRTISVLADIAEELMTNALYDAPAEAKYFATSISRTAAVELPPEHACEISYGSEGSAGFVRIRDPFGALTRQRMLAVLDRCNQQGVALDESRGGAGLGLWRVFSKASTITITVIPGRLTDILVWVDAGKRRQAANLNLNAVHLFFPADYAPDGALGRFAADHDYDLLDESFTGLLS